MLLGENKSHLVTNNISQIILRDMLKIVEFTLKSWLIHYNTVAEMKMYVIEAFKMLFMEHCWTKHYFQIFPNSKSFICDSVCLLLEPSVGWKPPLVDISQATNQSSRAFQPIEDEVPSIALVVRLITMELNVVEETIAHFSEINIRRNDIG